MIWTFLGMDIYRNNSGIINIEMSRTNITLFTDKIENVTDKVENVTDNPQNVTDKTLKMTTYDRRGFKNGNVILTTYLDKKKPPRPPPFNYNMSVKF